MLIFSWRALNGIHWSTVMYAKGSDRKPKQMRKEEVQAIPAVAFQTYGGTLEAVTAFKHLGRVLTASDYGCP